MIAATAQTWVRVRCPHCREVLAEVGPGSLLRKVCPKCRPKIAVLFDAATLEYAVELVTASGTALTLAPA